MAARGRGHILNVSSTAGKTVPPFMTVYASTKHAIAAFSWCLRLEMEPHGVGVSVVYPHYVQDVGMFARRGTTPPRAIGSVSVDEVVTQAIRAIEENKAEVVVAPGLIKVADLATALSVDGVIAMSKRTGAYDFNRREADKHS
jgi:short-subunit dehydrogenase